MADDVIPAEQRPPAPRPTPQEYRDLFEINKLGARILDDLIARFAGGAVADFDGPNAAHRTYFNAGRRYPIDFIVMQMNRANGIDDQTFLAQTDQDEP